MICEGCGADVGNGSIDRCDVHSHLNRDTGNVEITYWCPACSVVLLAVRR